MNMKSEQYRSSLYLVRRAESLLGALKFFAAPAANATERRLQFLAQSDFWEWEIDNLIYSFTNLAERSKTWQSSHHAIQKLGQLGFTLDAKLVQRVRWRGRWRVQEQTRRVAPVQLLKEVIDLWNYVVEMAEIQLVRPMQDKAERFGIQTRKDLNYLRKTMPQIELSEDA